MESIACHPAARDIGGQVVELGKNEVEAQLLSFTMLAEIAGTPNGRQLVREFIEPLRAHHDLLETLTGYLAHGGNTAAAAGALDVHHDTMLARLDRIAETICLDIRDPDNQFTLRLAIRLNLLTQVTAAPDREPSFH